MADLHPTPTRLRLLADVESGEVWQNSNGESVLTDSEVLGVSDPVMRVTARVAELEQASWVRLVELNGAKQWQLAEAGRALLDDRWGAQRAVMAALACGEQIWLPRWPQWLAAVWPGHRSPTLQLRALRRLGLVEAVTVPGGDPYPARVVLTAEGREYWQEGDDA